MGTARDLRGMVFGRLTVEERVGVTQHRAVVWRCKCSCGKTHDADSRQLGSGKTKSCGCLRSDNSRQTLTKHGVTTWRGKKPKLYSVWCEMRARCSRPTHKHYADYGGRGIKVCERWDDYELFEQDIAAMGPKPTASSTLDRKDNNGNYEPGNCRWASKEEQSRNRRNVKRLTFNGKTQTAAEWALELGIPAQTIRGRVRAGLSVHQCLGGATHDVRPR